MSFYDDLNEFNSMKNHILEQKIRDNKMINKLIQELKRIEQIKKPILRLKELEDLTDKKYPDLIKEEKKQIIKQVQKESNKI